MFRACFFDPFLMSLINYFRDDIIIIIIFFQKFWTFVFAVYKGESSETQMKLKIKIEIGETKY